MSVESLDAAALLASGCLIDVRSPAEYAQGHIPGAVNLPLFSDAERAEVGTLYKHQGRQAAVLHGLGTVGPKLHTMAAQLLEHAEVTNGTLQLYCWRGGMRSASVAWLAETLGISTTRLDGGYKRFRRWVLERFEAPLPLLLLGGRTGSGKTDLLHALHQAGAAVIDLEGLAHHRGSSFGGLGQRQQPSSEQFENLLALALVRLGERQPIWVEAESAQVGRCRIPTGLWRQMQRAPVVELLRPDNERVARLVAVYGTQERQDLHEATERISRRLGPQRTSLALAAIAAGDMASACVQMLDYYDRCYDHELRHRGRPPLLQLNGANLNETQLADQLMAWQQQQFEQIRSAMLA